MVLHSPITRIRIQMRNTVVTMLTASMLVAAVVGMPSSAQSQVVIIIGNGSAQPYYPNSYPNEKHSRYYAHGFDAGRRRGRNAKQRPIASRHHHRQWFCTALLPESVSILIPTPCLRRAHFIRRVRLLP